MAQQDSNPAIPSPLQSANVTGQDLQGIYTLLREMQRTQAELQSSIETSVKHLREIVEAHDEALTSTDHNNPGLIIRMDRMEQIIVRLRTGSRLLWTILGITGGAMTIFSYAKRDGFFGIGSRPSQPQAIHARADKP